MDTTFWRLGLLNLETTRRLMADKFLVRAGLLQYSTFPFPRGFFDRSTPRTEI